MGIDRTGPVGPLRSIPDTAGRDAAAPEATGRGTVGRDAGRTEPAVPIPSVRPHREDSIELSDQARVLSEASDDDREVLVERLRQQVSTGTYEVDADQIAREMVDHGDG